jgi:fatty-acyl-CoA synthase
MPEFPLTEAYWPAQTSTPLRDSTIGFILRDAAARAPTKIALIDGDPDHGERRRWTNLALLADAERAARALLRRFLPGERIAVWSGNSPEWVILEFAAALAGLTLVTVNPAYRGDELAHVLGHSRADGLFMADEYQGADLHAILAGVRDRLPRLREVVSFGNRDDFALRSVGSAPLPPVAPSDVAQLLYTSGTTGRPKGASCCYPLRIGGTGKILEGLPAHSVHIFHAEKSLHDHRLAREVSCWYRTCALSEGATRPLGSRPRAS